MEIHPACLALPALPLKARHDLEASIKAIGLQNPILTLDEQIIDGKNRYHACLAAHVEPRFAAAVLNGTDPVRFVLELNRHRLRTSSQLALAAARLATVEQGRPTNTGAKSKKVSKETFNQGGLTRDEAANACGVSKAAVIRAKAVLADGVDELIAYVEQGALSLGAAWWASRASKKQQTEACAYEVSKVRALAKDMREQSTGETGLPDLSMPLTRLTRVLRAMPLETLESAADTVIESVQRIRMRRAS